MVFYKSCLQIVQVGVFDRVLWRHCSRTGRLWKHQPLKTFFKGYFVQKYISQSLLFYFVQKYISQSLVFHFVQNHLSLVWQVEAERQDKSIEATSYKNI